MHGDGARCVTTLRSASVVIFKSRCCHKYDSAPTLRRSCDPAATGERRIFRSRKFFF